MSYRAALVGAWAPLALALLTVSAAPVVDSSLPSDPLSILLGYGPLGIVVIGFIVGWIVPGSQYKSLAEENRRLQAIITDTLFPLIDKAASNTERGNATNERVTEVLELVRQELHDLQRAK